MNPNQKLIDPTRRVVDSPITKSHGCHRCQKAREQLKRILRMNKSSKGKKNETSKS